MHSLRSGAADSSFLSSTAPFSLCLPMAPADAAADKQTRRARQQLPARSAVPWEAQTWQLYKDLDSSEARTIPAISRERRAGSQHSLPLSTQHGQWVFGLRYWDH